MESSMLIQQKIEHIEKELVELKKYVNTKPNESVEARLMEYHQLLDELSKCAPVDITPDELIKALHRKEY